MKNVGAINISRLTGTRNLCYQVGGFAALMCGKAKPYRLAALFGRGYAPTLSFPQVACAPLGARCL